MVVTLEGGREDRKEPGGVGRLEMPLVWELETQVCSVGENSATGVCTFSAAIKTVAKDKELHQFMRRNMRGPQAPSFHYHVILYGKGLSRLSPACSAVSLGRVVHSAGEGPGQREIRPVENL
jgi:hypothetical protein